MFGRKQVIRARLTSLARFMQSGGEVRVCRVCMRAVLQKQLQTAGAARSAAVVQGSDAVDGGGVDLDTQTSYIHSAVDERDDGTALQQPHLKI